MSSNVDFEAKTEEKSFVLSYEDEMTLGSYIILVDTDVLPLFRVWVVIFMNSRHPVCLLTHWTTLRLFYNSLAVFVTSSKCSKCPTTPFPVIDIVVVVTVSYGSSIFEGEPGVAFRFML